MLFISSINQNLELIKSMKGSIIIAHHIINSLLNSRGGTGHSEEFTSDFSSDRVVLLDLEKLLKAGPLLI